MLEPKFSAQYKIKSEQDLCEYFTWRMAKISLNVEGLVFFHVANEAMQYSSNKGYINYQRNLKRIGRIRGIPDYIVIPQTASQFFAIEFKFHSRRSQLSQYQKEVRSWMSHNPSISWLLFSSTSEIDDFIESKIKA